MHIRREFTIGLDAQWVSYDKEFPQVGMSPSVILQKMQEVNRRLAAEERLRTDTVPPGFVREFDRTNFKHTNVLFDITRGWFEIFLADPYGVMQLRTGRYLTNPRVQGLRSSNYLINWLSQQDTLTNEAKLYSWLNPQYRHVETAGAASMIAFAAEPHFAVQPDGKTIGMSVVVNEVRLQSLSPIPPLLRLAGEQLASSRFFPQFYLAGTTINDAAQAVIAELATPKD
jgi:hypothetical protein